MLTIALLATVSVELAFAADKKITACEAITESEASEFAGGPVTASYKDETLPTKQNHFTHITVCGFFPKGHDMRTATAQPERGLIVTLHSMRSPKEARAFYDVTANNAGSGETTTLSDVGDAALLKQGEVKKQQVVHLTFVKNAVAGHVSTWGKEKVGKTAVAIAKKVTARLP